MPDARPGILKKHSSRLDFFGLILSIFGPALLVYGIIAAPEAGWTSSLTLTLLIAGVVLSLIFIVWGAPQRIAHAQP